MNPPQTTPTIKILSEQLINKIAAGEVVERPASITKELIENAIDAGADQIAITIKNGGKDLISVLDNGYGMDEKNARLAIERHATSKIYAEGDLENIQTLGFRGEALASIASVSHFELLTCHDETQGGVRLSIKGGGLEQLSKTGFPQGTKITVQQLFFNTPARLKFMKTTPTEFRHIQETVLHQALARPPIQFRLTHNQQVVFSLSKGQSLEQRIYQLFGDEFQEGLVATEHQGTYLHYKGFLSLPTHLRSTKRWQYLFVNDRFVKCPAVNRAIYDAYRTLLGKNQHPVFFLKLYLEPSEIDVNVHPAKTEIRFRNNQLIHTILMDHLGKSLMAASHRRHFGNQMLPHLHQKAPALSQKPFADSAEDILLRPQPLQEQFDLTEAPLSQKPLSKKQASLSRYEKVGKTHKTRKTHTPLAKESSPSELEILQEESVPPRNFRVVGQLHQHYIVVEKRGSVVLFEQHAASERLLFEQYQTAYKSGQIPDESFSVPILLELPPQNAILLEQYLLPFQKLGFGIEPFGKTTYSLQSIPALLPKEVCQKTILAILDDLSLFGKKGRNEEIFHHILEKVACHSAIKRGELLKLETMQRLIAQLEQIEIHHFHPHGQPMMIELSLQELEKRFTRAL